MVRCLNVCQTPGSLDTLLHLGPNIEQNPFYYWDGNKGWFGCFLLINRHLFWQEEKPGEMREVQESLLLQREMPGRKFVSGLIVDKSYIHIYLCIERRLGHAQAGVLCHERVRREMVPIRDNPTGGADPRQEGRRETPDCFCITSISGAFVHRAGFPSENAEGQMCFWEAVAHRRDAVTWVVASVGRLARSRTAAVSGRHGGEIPLLRVCADTEDMDNERRETMEADVAGLHQFFSKHLEIPSHKDLLTLFSQVLRTHNRIRVDFCSFPGAFPEEMTKEKSHLFPLSFRSRATVSL